MKLLLLIAAVISCSFLFAGCDKDHDHDDDDHDHDAVVIYPFADLKIPYGHLPPPGLCKIWIPGVPPGHQGSPQSCHSAMHDAPPGSWVITRTKKNYKVNILNHARPPVIIDVRYYALP